MRWQVEEHSDILVSEFALIPNLGKIKHVTKIDKLLVLIISHVTAILFCFEHLLPKTQVIFLNIRDLELMFYAASLLAQGDQGNIALEIKY